MTIKNRLSKLEKQLKPKETEQICKLTIYHNGELIKEESIKSKQDIVIRRNSIKTGAII